jgi:hypothetical protein
VPTRSYYVISVRLAEKALGEIIFSKPAPLFAAVIFLGRQIGPIASAFPAIPKCGEEHDASLLKCIHVQLAFI